MSTLKVATIQDLSSANSSTPEQIAQGRAKAWVRFNSVTTTTITDSYNVSSLTDVGAGVTDINFATAMANANYAVAGFTNQTSGNAAVNISRDAATSPTTSVLRVTTEQSATRLDVDFATVIVIGD